MMLGDVSRAWQGDLMLGLIEVRGGRLAISRVIVRCCRLRVGHLPKYWQFFGRVIVEITWMPVPLL